MKRIRAVLDGMNDLEKVLYVGLALVAAGLALSPLPYLGLAVPGAVLIFLALRAKPDVLAELADLESEDRD
jgi:uncharacterized membrane protein